MSGRQAPGVPLSPTPSVGIANTHHHLLLSLFVTWILSQALTCVTSAQVLYRLNCVQPPEVMVATCLLLFFETLSSGAQATPPVSTSQELTTDTHHHTHKTSAFVLSSTMKLSLAPQVCPPQGRSKTSQSEVSAAFALGMG